LENNWATEQELEAIDEKSREFVEECIEFMESSPYPDAKFTTMYILNQIIHS
jgi:pyruvate dehydrogenase E1 component alpha subunit